MAQRLIRPCHVFSHRGSRYAINSEDMTAFSMDDETAEAMEKLAADPDLALDPEVEGKIRELGVMSEAAGRAPKAGKADEPVPVVNMSLFLTQSCNLRCVYCYGEGGEYGTGGSMDEKTAFQAVDWMVEQSGKIRKLHIGFFGGEPLLRFPLLKAIVGYAEKKVAEAGKIPAFHGTTNATLLDDEKIAFLKEHDITFMISFDGTRELQDRQRPFADGRGSYDSALPGIKKLLAAMPKIHGHAIITADTDPKIVRDALLEIGFQDISISPASRSLFAEKPGSEQQAARTCHVIDLMEEEAERWVASVKNRDIGDLKALKTCSELYYGIMSLLHNTRKFHACGAGLGLVAVACSGDVYLCHRFVGRDEYRLGSVFDRELKREEYQKSPVKGNNRLCTACFARYYCAGGCKHDNAGSCGSISKPPEDMCTKKCRELELSASVACRLDSADRAFLTGEEIFPPKPCPFDF
jgi:uncharacterized protein